MAVGGGGGGRHRNVLRMFAFFYDKKRIYLVLE